jgi:hypothetical protein
MYYAESPIWELLSMKDMFGSPPLGLLASGDLEKNL